MWRLGTEDRITNVNSRWSIEARYMPRDSVVDVDAQMKREYYKSEFPKTSCEVGRRRKNSMPSSHQSTLAHERVLGEWLLVIVLPRGQVWVCVCIWKLVNVGLRRESIWFASDIDIIWVLVHPHIVNRHDRREGQVLEIDESEIG